MKKILVIEDETNVLETIEDVLIAEGFDVLTANDGETGLEIIRTNPPDLILCDVRMPVMDGITVLKILRQKLKMVTTPFIFLTAQTTKASQREGMNWGADDYLTKPFTTQELLDAINSRLEHYQNIQAHNSDKLENLRRNLTMALPHELRTPLQGILTSAELLGEYWDTLSREEIEEITKNIRFSTNRLNQLIQKFLVYVQLDAVLHQSGDFNEGYFGTTRKSDLVIQALAGEIARQYGRNGNLKFDLCAANVAISEKWLSTLIQELMDNACKFSQPGEGVAPLDLTILVRSYVEGDRWVLEVQDYGRGMTTEQIQNIGAYMQFDRWQYEQQGAGLGLAIAERIVKIYRGTMTIDSKVKQGSLFTISLPLADDSVFEDANSNLKCNRF